MRVLFHLHSTLGNPTGIGHYTNQLYRCLQGLIPDEILPSLPQTLLRFYGRLGCRCGPVGDCEVAASKKRRPESLLSRAAAPVRNLSHRASCRLTRLSLKAYQWARVRAGLFDVYHEPNFMPSPCRRPTVATIHDLSVLLHPEWHPADRVAWFQRGLKRMLAQCVHFLTVSESARREIVRVLGVPASRVSRTYNGVRPWLRPMSDAEARPALRALGLRPGYLLYVGTIEPRKNVLTLLRAYCDLPRALRERHPLVLAGGWGWKAEPVADYFDSVARHRGAVRLGYVPEASLGALYNGARALAFPSVYEGFGLPPVEMLACGGAVLASTAEAVAEVAGPAAPLIEPHDLGGWRDALRRALTDDAWLASLRDGAAEYARPFTWDKCAADTLRVYRSVAAGNFDCAPPSPAYTPPIEYGRLTAPGLAALSRPSGGAD